MGVDYRGQLCVGYTYEEALSLLKKSNCEGDLYDFLEKEDLQSFGPYFDASEEDCIYGYSVSQSSDYDCKEVVIEKVALKVRELKRDLLEEYGIEPKAYIMAQGT